MGTDTAAATPSHRVRRSWAYALLVGAITTLAFARLATCSFTDWDDSDTIAANPHLNPPGWTTVWFYWTTIGEKTPGQLFTPVTYTVWSAAAAMSNVLCGTVPDPNGITLSPAVFHGVNVLLHAASAVAAFGLLHRLFRNRWAAVAGGLLYALHPVQVEPVGWASGTKDVLCGMFSLAALYVYVVRHDTKPASDVPPRAESPPRGRARNRLLTLLSTLLFLLAMLSKPTAIVVPLLAAAIDRLLLGRPWRRVARSLWPWAALMIPCALWTRAAQPAPWAATPLWQRPLVAADALAFYLCKIAWPAHLTVDYGHRPAAVFASGVAYYSWLLPAAVAGLVLWRARRVGLAAIALFLLPLLPVVGLAPFDFQFFSTTADHYLYLPMFAVALLATWALTCATTTEPSGSAAGLSVRQRTRGGAAGLCGVVIVVLVALAARSFAQMGSWRDSTSLFTHALAVNPRSFAACDQLGYAEVKAARRASGGRPVVPPGDPAYAAWRDSQERSLTWYYRALEIYDAYVPALTNIASNAQRLGRYDEQRAALRRVVALQPAVPPGLRADPIGLANRLLAAGDPATAIRVLDPVLRDDPTNVPAIIVRNRALAMPAK